ncbi:MAG TPA: hypothetical protein VJN63_10360, partial [Thermoplasmata archaeon]|nr:hypothetical protein [Thermoplasmata archaeon]
MRSGGGSRRALLLTATLLGLAFSSAPFASSPPPTAPESGPIAPEPAGPICPGVRYAPGVRTLSLPPGPVILAPCPGGEIAYLDQGGIVVMYSNGTGNSVVYTARTSLSRPTWSPDGRSLAFRDGSQVWRIDVSLVEGRFVGSAPVALTTEEAWNPAWSPLQGEIAVTTRSPGRWSLGIIPAIGGAVQVIYLPQSGSNIFGRPGWSLDGTRIAFAEVDATGVSTIKVLDRATLSVLSSHALVGITGVRDVDWARTKDVVAFNDEVEQFPGKGVDLYTLDLKTGEATFVADQAYHASWGPDDSRIVYTKSCSYGGGCTI